MSRLPFCERHFPAEELEDLMLNRSYASCDVKRLHVLSIIQFEWVKPFKLDFVFAGFFCHTNCA